MPAKVEMQKAALPTEPEPGIKWRKDTAEIELSGTPKTITDNTGAKYEIPDGYTVDVVRWAIESDHELVLGQVYLLVGKKFDKPTQTFVSPNKRLALRGGKILYRVDKIKPISSAPAKARNEVEIDERFTAMEAVQQQILEALTK